MQLKDKVAVITGGASGIGKALAVRFLEEGAKGVVIADRQEQLVRQVGAEIGATALACDVTNENDILQLVALAETQFGPIDVFVSNAGIAEEGTEHADDEAWYRNWNIHVMAHIYAARAVASQMAERGSGYLVNTSSAAGLLTHVNAATYAVTKHAAVAFAEYLAITYGPKGVKVSVLCPQAVRTAMTQGREGSVASVDGMIEPEELANSVICAMDEETFLILPHPVVLKYMQRKTGDYDRWLRGMQRLKHEYKNNGQI
jgi:NAD(P)-dependent dehydrogenase (short-subunit alcohol dehydrogenase family)